MLESLPTSLRHLLPADLDTADLSRYFHGLVVLALTLVLAAWVKRLVRRITSRHTSPQHGMIASRMAYGVVFGIGLFQAMQSAGIEIGVLLGAAGLLTVAVGFAAQTSTANLISGLFLMAEQPFVLGDSVRIGTTDGEVVSIDLLSVKLRTFDNLLVRIPNESLLKSEITNLTRYPIRRLDVNIGLAYGSDVARARAVLMELADADPRCLVEPKPLFFFLRFGDSSLETRFSVWVATPSFVGFRTDFQIAIHHRLTEEGILIPFPQRTLSTDRPLAIQLVSSRDPMASEDPEGPESSTAETESPPPSHDI